MIRSGVFFYVVYGDSVSVALRLTYSILLEEYWLKEAKLQCINKQTTSEVPIVSVSFQCFTLLAAASLFSSTECL